MGDVAQRKELTVGALVAERYEVLSVLGRGAFGVTYRALDRVLSREVAVKELWLWRQHDWAALDRFAAEGRVLRSLNHPCIPRYLSELQATTEEGDAFYLVQEIAPGRTLRQWVDDGRRFSESEVVSVGLALLDCLAHLARTVPPIVHRDIKPENVLLDEDGRVSLVDFGAVKEWVDGHTSTGTWIGTIGYMAPEQAVGRATPRSDLFGVAATLVFMATRTDPASLPERNGRPDLGSVPVPPPVRRILERCLDARPERRPANAAAAAAKLRAGSQVVNHVVTALVGLGAFAGPAALTFMLMRAPSPARPDSSLPVALDEVVASCRLRSNPGACITDAAVAGRNEGTCVAHTLLPNAGHFSSCVADVARATRSVAPCALNPDLEADACRKGVAVDLADAALCDESPQRWQRKDCRSQIAREHRDPKYCDKLVPEDRESCQMELLDFLPGTPTEICKTMWRGRAACAAHFAVREPRVCELLPYHRRMDCFESGVGRLARERPTGAIKSFREFCAALSPAERDGCLYVAAERHPEACLLISAEPLRVPCVVASAANAQDAKVCKVLPSELWQECASAGAVVRLPGACDLLAPGLRAWCREVKR